MAQSQDERKAMIMAWYEKMSQTTRSALELVGVTFVPWDNWTLGCYFVGAGKSWTPVDGRTSSEDYARNILDEIARRAGAAAQPAQSP